MAAPRVNAIVVNYRKWDLTRRCLDALAASIGVDLRIVLVDNQAVGEPPAWLSDVPGLRFLPLAANTGFAGGNNAGFALSREVPAPFTFFVNNDAEVAPDAVAMLADVLAEKEAEGAGISCPAIYYASDPDRVWGAGGDFVPLKMRYRQNRYPTRGSLPPVPERTRFASGCALMIRSGLFEAAGGFREDFFMYFEDAALCEALRDAGHSAWLVPGASVLHHVGAASGGPLSPLPVYFSERNRLLLSRTVLSPGARAAFLAYVSAVLLVKTVKFLVWQGPGLVPWIWRGYLDGLLGTKGAAERMRRLLG